MADDRIGLQRPCTGSATPCIKRTNLRVRTRSGPRIMAAMRHLTVSALRLAGHTDITEATRWASRSMDQPFTILGLI